MRKLIGLSIIGIGFIAILLGIFGYLMAPFSLTWQAYVTMIFLIVVGVLLIAIGIVVYRKGKMTIKQFLKPDWRKIVLFFIFIFIDFALITKPSSIEAYTFNPFFSFLRVAAVAPLFWFKWLYNSFLYTLDRIYWYVLSCFIVWIYDKVKR